MDSSPITTNLEVDLVDAADGDIAPVTEKNSIGTFKRPLIASTSDLPSPTTSSPTSLKIPEPSTLLPKNSKDSHQVKKPKIKISSNYHVLEKTQISTKH